MAVAPDGSILVSNQDSNTVTRYGAPNSPNAGKPLTSSGAIDADTKSAGLVVPSHEMTKHGVKEVRGIAVTSDGTLLVADRGKGEVTAWNLATGERLRVLASKNDGIETPIQLLIAPDESTLYISDNKRNEVFRLQLPDGKASVFIGEDAGIDATSSLAIHDGYLYVGSRKAREILRFRLSDGVADEKPFIANLPDNPEFFIANPSEAKP
jgi:sugar lactone lactonase YvrE